jgi:RHS repeat-associated protein
MHPKGVRSGRRIRLWIAAATLAGILCTALQASSSVFAMANPVRPPAGPATAAVKLPPSSGEPASRQPRKRPVGEQPDLGTRFSSTRYNADHSFTTSTSVHPLNYRAANGAWQPIDNTLIASKQIGYAYQNGANSFQAQFKSQLGDDYLRWVVDGQAVSMSLKGASPARGSAKGSTIAYPGALSHVDATYSVLGDGLEEVLELRDASAAASFQFLLKTPAGTTVAQQADGGWVFALPGRAPGSFWLKAPYAYDSGAKSVDPGQPHARMSVTGVQDGFQVTLSVDGAWLHDPARRFPVFVDPTISVQPDTLDTTFVADCATCQGFVDPSGRMFIGVSAFPHTYREALQFDLSAIPAGVSVTGARLGVFYDQACVAVPGQFCGGIDHQVDVHRMTGPWSTSSTTSAVQFDSTVLSSFLLSAGAGQEWMSWDVTSAASAWVSGTQPNYGLYLMLASEKKGDSGPAPPGNTFQVGQLAPVLTVTYSGDAVSLAQPSTLHANGAELSWAQYTGPSGAPFQQYQVHRSLTPNFTPSAATQLTSIADLSTTTFRDTTAAPGGTFNYAVVANSSKSNEVKVALPADGQSAVSLQPGPGQDKATFMYLYDKFVNCANYGADQFLAAGADSTGVYRSLLQFDLPQIPSTATNVSAKLNVLHFFENSIDMTFHAYPATSSWEEGMGTRSPAACTGNGATWYERTGGVQWNTQGGDYDAGTPSSQVSIPANETENWDSFDVSSIVSKWVSGQAPNLGFLLKSDSETEGTFNFAVFASNDYSASPAVRPQLQVTYTDGSHATPPTVSISAPAPGAMVRGSSVTLSAAAASGGALSQVQFFVDGSPVSTAGQAAWQVTWNSTSVANGSHTITAQATDSAGNSTTSAGVAVTVNNFTAPTTAIASPANNATGLKGTVSLTTSETVASGLTVSKVELYVDGALYATATASPWSFSWNTLDAVLPSFDGTHTLVSKVYDSSGLNASSATTTVIVANTAGTKYKATSSPALVPQAMSYDPNASTQLVYPVDVGITNSSTVAWSSTTTSVRYRWYLAGSTTSFSDSASVASLGNAAGAKQTMRVNVTPPTLPAGMDAARFVLRFDVLDSSVSPAVFFAAKGNLPLDNPVIVNKVLGTNLGLEHYWQYTSQPVGAGINHMVNVANGNSILMMTPFREPGRGLSTEVQLTYNSREEHSDSPMGNNWSLAISGLTRFGDPLDIHPNNADTIAGRSNKFIDFVDGDGTIHRFTGVTAADGTTFWEEPPGVHLWLRSVTTDIASPRYWALTRSDRVTFWYNHDGFPTFVTDGNGNTLAFTLTAVQAGDDPGGPKFHVTKVTDADGRALTISYFTKATARKPQIRGKVASITDHVGHQLSFAYYDDGNLLSITEQGGHNADGSFLASRNVIFTYTTSDGSGPAISDPSLRVNPDPKTPNESTKVYSVRDYDGHETTFTYDGPTTGIDRWKLASVKDRAGAVTTYAYDDLGLVTTVAEPTPGGQTSRTYKYAYDVLGRPTQITDPLQQRTSLQWSPDNAVTQITAPDTTTRKFTYNDNGYPTDLIDELGDHTRLTYQNLAADATDVSAHWNPAGGANGTGRTVPHLSQVATKQDPKEVAAGSQNLWGYGYDGNGNLTSVIEPLFPNNPATNTYNADGTLATSKDFLGNQTTYLAYDANGLPTRIADATDSPTAPTHPLQMGYDAAGRTLFVQDQNHASFTGGMPANYQTQFLYDSFGRLGRQTTPKSTTFSLGTLVESDTRYDPNDNVLSRVAPHCVPRGACTNETASSDVGAGDTSTFGYDFMDRKVAATDPSGNKTNYTYDVAGRLTRVTLPLGVLNGTPSNTRTVNYVYDALDRTTIQTQNHVNPDGSVSALNTLACYDLAGNMVSVTKPKAGLSSLTCPGTTSTPFTTVYGYDAAHHPTSVTDPLTADGLHHTTTSTYDADGNRITATDANNNTTTYTYDALDRLTQTSTPFITGSSPHPAVSRSVYDAHGNVVQSFSPRAVDCSQVSACEATGGTNYVTISHYDQLNRLVRQDLPVDGSFPTHYYVHRAYDFNGNLLSTSLAATQSDPTQVPAALKTVSAYFDPGWIASEQVGTDPRIHYDYNGKGQQTLRVPESKSGGLDFANQVFWSYQPNGLLANRTDQQNQPVAYHYDPDGNLVTAHDASGLTDSSQTPVDTQNTYDDLDRLVRSDLKKQSEANWTFSSFGYDPNGNVIDQDQNGLEQSPGGVLVKDGHKIHTNYDGNNWLTDQLDSTLNQQVLDKFTPIGLELRREIDKSNGVGGWTPLQTTTWDYFANGKLSNLSTVNGGGTTLESHTVSYLDSNGVYLDGNRTRDTYSLRPGGSGSSSCYPGACTATFGYDPHDRLVRNDDGHGGVTTYTLDGAGNILTQVASGVTTTNTYSGNQLQQSVTGGQTLKYWYDDLGRQQCVTTLGGSQADCNPSENTTASTNLVNDNRYDYLDRLQTYRTFSGGTRTDEANYVYDAENRQVQESEQHPAFNGDTHVTQFSYLGTSNLDVEEQQTSKSSGNLLSIKDFTYDVNGHRLAMTSTPYTNGQPGTPTTYTYGYDVHGSVSQLVDPNGGTKASYGYTPYGQQDSHLSQGDTDKTTPLNPFRYSAKRLDTGSGTLDMGARRFGPDTSHFLSPDFFYGSLANLGLSTDPITGNRYDLAGGNPISFKESDGHMVSADGGGGGSTSPAPTEPPATQPSKNSDGEGAPAHKSCGWNFKCQIQQHAQHLKKISDVSGKVAGVAGTIAGGCAVFGVITAETVAGGVVGGGCATVAGGIATGASGVSFASGALAKAGGANVSNTDLALSAVGASPGVGAIGRSARAAVEEVEEGARSVQGLEHAAQGPSRVFWSGGTKAMNAAVDWAKANGGTTLDMTKHGQALEAATRGMEWTKARPLWEPASRDFAQGASGEIHVFHNAAGIGVNSDWAQVEYPELVDNLNVTNIVYHDVGGYW